MDSVSNSTENFLNIFRQTTPIHSPVVPIASWCDGIVIGLYLGGTRFESQPEFSHYLKATIEILASNRPRPAGSMPLDVTYLLQLKHEHYGVNGGTNYTRSDIVQFSSYWLPCL
jgi:hypothetical protein